MHGPLASSLIASRIFRHPLRKSDFSITHRSQYPPRTGRFLYFVSFLILLSTFMFVKISYDYPTKNAEEGDAMAWVFVEGVWSVVISLTLLHFFAQHCNVTGPWLKRLNDAAYMVYMLHFYFICVFLWAYAWMVS